jgi:hypothetical protein
MTVRLGIIATLAITTLPLTSQAETLFERLIAAQNPCAALQSDLANIDHLDYVRVDEVVLALHGDVIDARLTGALSCKTSDAAFFRGSVGATLQVTAQMQLPGCQTNAAEVTLSNITGEFGPVLEAGRPLAEEAIRSSLGDALTKACTTMVVGLTP